MIYIGLGANLGSPVKQVREAIEDLRHLSQSTLISISSLYQTRPLGPGDQADYINAVAALKSELSPIELLDQLQLIEKRHGRVRHEERWGPRTLDLDILLYGDLVLHSERLTLPHPGVECRCFVLTPLNEVAPELTLPSGVSIADLVHKHHCEALEPLNSEVMS